MCVCVRVCNGFATVAFINEDCSGRLMFLTHLVLSWEEELSFTIFKCKKKIYDTDHKFIILMRSNLPIGSTSIFYCGHKYGI